MTVVAGSIRVTPIALAVVDGENNAGSPTRETVTCSDFGALSVLLSGIFLGHILTHDSEVRDDKARCTPVLSLT
jgi:hypothetical protein